MSGRQIVQRAVVTLFDKRSGKVLWARTSTFFGNVKPE